MPQNITEHNCQALEQQKAVLEQKRRELAKVQSEMHQVQQALPGETESMQMDLGSKTAQYLFEAARVS